MDIAEIEKAVEHATGMNWNQIMNHTQYREVVFARQLCMSLIRKYTILSRREIGLRFNRDPATVYYAEKTIDNLIDTDKEVRKIYKKANSICWAVSRRPDHEVRQMCINVSYYKTKQ